MIFSEQDIELLRLLRWCRISLPDTIKTQFPESVFSNLIACGLIRKHRTSGALLLTAEGHSLLESIFSDLPENTPLVYKSADTLRRIRLSSVMLTAYRAGLTVFTTELSDLHKQNTYYAPSLMREKGKNPWSNSRIGGILHLGDWLFAAHYVCPGIGVLLLNDEVNSFINNTAKLEKVQRGFLFAGESYESILTELRREPEASDSQRVSYADAYRKLHLPILLLPCDDVGAVQLQLLTIPDYRQRLTRAALRSQYEPPPAGIVCWDAMFQGLPFVMAADMNLKRVEDALQAAKEAGFRQITLVCLEAQAEAVFFPYYRDSGLARVFILTAKAMEQAVGHPIRLRTSEAKQFVTEEGAVIDAPIIKTDRKTGRPHRKPAR